MAFWLARAEKERTDDDHAAVAVDTRCIPLPGSRYPGNGTVGTVHSVRIRRRRDVVTGRPVTGYAEIKGRNGPRFQPHAVPIKLAAAANGTVYCLRKARRFANETFSGASTRTTVTENVKRRTNNNYYYCRFYYASSGVLQTDSDFTT